jgi:hypothetical protein
LFVLGLLRKQADLRSNQKDVQFRNPGDLSVSGSSGNKRANVWVVGTLEDLVVSNLRGVSPFSRPLQCL